ncbi:MAG: NADH:ubiquinone reductase (Na(+)-transporting) subunit B [Alphaproteobacteria bacterium]|nr:NADH:ubiquinone reductase (Na(+)-transporting) subunit B [Alphaproteobacteria bacterium]
MLKALERLVDANRAPFEEGGRLHWAWPLYEGAETFLLTVGTKTSKGVHVRDPMDMKRLMMFVIYAMVPAILMGMWNVGARAFQYEGITDATTLECLLRGAWHMLPIIIVSYTAGGIAELVFCVVRKHEVSEGFLVTAMLYPLTLPPTTPLWMVAAGIVFGVVIGKEVFGGVGMNILNPALTARAFVFFTYPAVISGAYVWDVVGVANPLTRTGEAVDGYTGATALLAVSGADRGAQAVDVLAAQGWDWWALASGAIPGSMGEVSAIAALVGAVALVLAGLAAWQTMVGAVVGLAGVAMIFNAFAGPDSLALLTLPPHYHLVMGGFAFGAVFMATDPVSSATTTLGRWIYGLGIGAMCGLIRVINPAYPEGMMLAILFMNVFAPLIDHYVVQATTRRRVARMATVAS